MRMSNRTSSRLNRGTVVGILAAVATASTAIAGVPYISISHLASTPRAGYDVAGAEIVAFDAATSRSC